VECFLSIEIKMQKKQNLMFKKVLGRRLGDVAGV
jgi:hypothetical protein